MRDVLMERIEAEKKHWRKEPVVHYGQGFQDCLVLVFGEPRTAVFAHMDSVGFTVKNSKELVKVGGPKAENGLRLVGRDAHGEVECTLNVQKKEDDRGRQEEVLTYDAPRSIERGTSLTFKPHMRQDKEFITCCYMDDRLGVLNAFKLCETMEHGAVVFSAWEEHGGGSVGSLGRFLFEHYGIQQALISDITWVTEDIHHGKGVAVSMRDSGIPRRAYVERILELADRSGIPYQLEVEGAGGSDGIALQRSPFPFDWCFIGAPESGVHSPDETVHTKDAESMTELYRYLLERL